jgi:S-DNA-T family DNA segregation ATPase FtsK/SpoIIIE
MEQLGIVGPPEGSKPREILVDEEDAQSLLERARTREV